MRPEINFVNVVKQDFFSPRLAMYLASKANGRTFCVENIIFTEVLEGTALSESAKIDLTPELAQRLIDSLWNCGVRPSEGSGSAGAMAATQKHLEDMRKLVFKDKL